jgi:peptidoglycan/LPS O-acetylase OafA/YrhL
MKSATPIVKSVAPRHRIAYIDGLRAVAVLLVVSHHAIDNHPRVGPFMRFLDHGNHGVELFFVLSGFCLSYPTLAKLHREGQTSFDLVRYAAHRVVRIVPPYWLAIVATLIFGFIIARLGYALPVSFGHFTALNVVQQALFIDQGVPLVSGPFWTLPVEFRWYFLFPIMLWLWTRSPKAFAVVGVCVFLALFTRVQNFDALYFAPFILGIVAADVHIRGKRLGYWTLGFCAIALIYAAITPWVDADFLDRMPIWYFASFAFVIAAGEFGWLTKLLSMRALTAIGIASYSIYLVHAPIVTFMGERGCGFWMSSTFGVAAGFAFWAVAERPFVSTWLRSDLIRRCEGFFARALSGVGIARSMMLEERRVIVKSLNMSRGVGSNVGGEGNHQIDGRGGGEAVAIAHPVDAGRTINRSTKIR